MPLNRTTALAIAATILTVGGFQGSFAQPVGNDTTRPGAGRMDQMSQTFADPEQLQRFAIGISERAARSEQEAAAELQSYWKAVFGVEPGIVHQPVSGPMVWVGFEGAPEEALAGLDTASFKPQELIIRTFERDGQPHLLIAGGPDRGTEHGVYQFIEDYLGVRWLTAWDTHIPEAPAALPRIELRYCPVFDYRYSSYMQLWRKNIDPETKEKGQRYMRVHRWRYGPGFGTHTFYRYVRPEEYAADHPEYFALVDGKRLAPPPGFRENKRALIPRLGQLCMTNPGVIEAMKKGIEREIEEQPDLKIHQIGQEDWHNWCECEICAAIDEAEGTHMASVMHGANQIAEWLEQEHPGHSADLLAYQYTRTPPRTMKPHPNMSIKLCSIECDFARPYNDLASAGNKPFADDLRQWGAIASRVHVREYISNFFNYHMAYPCFHVLQPNMQFLAANNVKGIFPEGPRDRTAEFAPLKMYLISKLMWNPDIDFEATMDEFLELYYHEAAPHIRAYIALLTNAQQASGRPMGCFDAGKWYDAATIREARVTFEEALAAVRSPEIRERVERVQLTLEFAALKCAPEVQISEDRITVSRPKSLTFDEYEDMLIRLGAKCVCGPHRGTDHFRKQLGGVMREHRIVSPLLTLENDRYLVWVAPRLHGSILRFHDKNLDAELLADPAVYGQRGGFWQDWTDTPGDYEHVIASAYEVVEHTGDRLVLEVLLESGLRVRRTMTLTPGSDTFDVSLTVTNESGEPQAPNAKLHPEFFLPAGRAVEIHGLRDGVWRQLNEGDEGRSKTMYFDPEYERFAYYLPKEDLSVHVDVGDTVGGVLCYYTSSADKQHMNLDLRPPQRDLAPGESVTFGGSYGATTGNPHTAAASV